MPFNYLSQVKQVAENAGNHFFSKDTMRFFSSRIMSTVYAGKDHTFFVTSEKFDYNSSRRYSVRAITDAGETSTVGEFGEWATREGAIGFAKQCAERQKEGKDIILPGGTVWWEPRS